MPEVSGFTEKYLERLRPKDGAIQTDFMDTSPKFPGFGVRVGRRSKSFFLFYFWNARRVRLTLGTYPAVSLKEAHRRVTEARACIKAFPPIDPRTHFATKKAEQGTIESLVEDFLAKDVRARELRTADDIERVMRKEVIPTIGRLPILAVHRRDLKLVTDQMIARGSKVGAVRCHTMLRMLFKWAVQAGELDHNPMELSVPPPFKGTPRDTVLEPKEIKQVWHGTEAALADEQLAKSFQRIFRLCLATSGRVGEVTGLQLSELGYEKDENDKPILDRPVWRIPPERSKNKHAHTMPLSPLAMEIIAEAKADAGRSRFLFPSPRTSKAIGANTVVCVVKTLRERLGMKHFTTHDLRRSVATQMARPPLKVSQIVIAHILNHRSVFNATVTSKHYVQHDYMEEMRAALDAWADRLREFVA
jgi:integrase